MSWHLDDAELRAEQHESFSVPSREEREGLVVGDHAKLIFLLGEPITHPERAPLTGERMWVKVTRCGGAPLAFAGELCSAPVAVDIPEKTLVEFGPEHVIAVQQGDTLAAVFERDERSLRDLVGALLETERYPADHYVETRPVCIWCDRGKKDAERTYDASEIDHREGCPWAALVRAYGA